MPSNYPANLDSWPTIGPLLSSTPHSSVHEDLQDAVEAIQTELGTDPAGPVPTVRANLEQLRRVYANFGARPVSGEYVGQRIWLSGPQMEQTWTGAHWKITDGTMPSCRLFRDSGHASVSTVGSTIALGGHSGVSGGFRTGNTLTIPANSGGVYTLDFGGEFTSGTTLRYSFGVLIGNNTTGIPDTASPTQLVTEGLYQAGVSNWTVTGLSKQMAFRAGATITMSGSISVAGRGPVMSYISLTMHSHHPEWT